MKKHLFFCLSLLVLLAACGKSDDVEQVVAPSQSETPTTPDTPSTPDDNPDTPDTPSTPGGVIAGHEYVDLGLPSGTLWATCNVGADSPADCGDYFAWGETSPKEIYDWSNYKWCNGSETTLTKYCTDASYGTVDGKYVLEAADDAAAVNWGGGWRMPTLRELQELSSGDYCTRTKTTKTNSKGQVINGYEITSISNGNSIFLPATDFYYEGGALGEHGYYWLSSLTTDKQVSAFCLIFLVQWNDYYTGTTSRYSGHSVRPVCTAPPGLITCPRRQNTPQTNDFSRA